MSRRPDNRTTPDRRETAFACMAMLMAAILLPACSPDGPDAAVVNETSQVTDEGPYGGHSVAWYKLHWNNKTREQRKWCWQQNEAADRIRSCLDAHKGWKLGRNDPATNPPRRWEDGPRRDI